MADALIKSYNKADVLTLLKSTLGNHCPSKVTAFKHQTLTIRTKSLLLPLESCMMDCESSVSKKDAGTIFLGFQADLALL